MIDLSPERMSLVRLPCIFVEQEEQSISFTFVNSTLSPSNLEQNPNITYLTDGLQAKDQPDKTDIAIKPSMETSKSGEEEDAATEAEEKQVLTTETNQSEQVKENNPQEEEEEEEVSSSIVDSKDSSATANTGSANLLLPPADQLSVPHVVLPPKDTKEEEEKGDDTTQQAQQHSAAQKVMKSNNAVATVATVATVALQPNIGMGDAIAKCSTHARPLATSQSNGDDNDGEEKKMDDDDLAIAQPRSPPKTPDIKASGVPTTANVEPSPLGSSPQSDTTKAKSMPTPSSTTCSSSSSGGGNDGRSLEKLMTTDDMANATMEQKVDGVSGIYT